MKQARREYNRRWSREHPESVRASNKKQFEKNREARLEYGRLYHAANRERRREYAKLYHQKHYAEKRLKLLAQTKEYARSHPEIRHKIHVNYKRRHPESYRAQMRSAHARRKARMRGADVSDIKVGALIRKWHLTPTFFCYYCGQKFSTSSLQVDHVLPVSKGGKHSVSNICKCCPQCNPSKGDRLISDHVVNGQLLLV